MEVETLDIRDAVILLLCWNQITCRLSSLQTCRGAGTCLRVFFNPIGPGRFCDAYVPGGMFFHPPLKNDFLLQKRVIFHLDIKLGIILALF